MKIAKCQQRIDWKAVEGMCTAYEKDWVVLECAEVSSTLSHSIPKAPQLELITSEVDQWWKWLMSVHRVVRECDVLVKYSDKIVASFHSVH